MDEFTPRNAVKFVVTQVIKVKAAKKTESIITGYTSFDEDDLVVDIAGGLVGWYLGDLVKPYTDKVIDKAADFIVAKRAEMKAKKDQKTEEEK
jgi:hypothetical protein